MEKLISPWRSKYIESFKPGNKKEDEECLFCKVLNDSNDKENYLLFRGEKAFVMMNLYPYNSGHLMVVPNTHSARFQDIDIQANAECISLLQSSCDILQSLVYPHGFNIGVNIGKVSGAGIDSHIHYHIVPRWNGDTNFMPVLADVKVVSQEMEDMYLKLTEYFKKLK